MTDEINVAKERKGTCETQETQLFGLRMLEVVPIVEGCMGEEGGAVSPSVTLIKTSTNNIVVDSGIADIAEEITDKLKDHGVFLEKVNVLVTTSAPSAYRENDHLFTHALQHLIRDHCDRKSGPTGRRIVINTDCHWIDRFLKLVVLPFPETRTLALFVLVPSTEEMLEPGICHLAGKIVGIVGEAVRSWKDPEVQKALEEIRAMGDGGAPIRGPDGINCVKDLLLACDYIIPGRGPMFATRG